MTVKLLTLDRQEELLKLELMNTLEVERIKNRVPIFCKSSHRKSYTFEVIISKFYNLHVENKGARVNGWFGNS